MLLEVLVTLALSISPGLTVNTFQYSPADANGVLTTCVGRSITIACSHDNDANGITRWLFSSPIDCSETIDHNPPIFTRPCGPFTFINVTEIGSSPFFNSSAVAIASSSISGTTVECRDSSGDVYNQIGTTTICIIDQPRDIVIINGNHIIWTGTTCVGAAISYRVEVVRMNDSVPVDIIVTPVTDAQLSNLQPNQMYSVFVTTIGSTCSSEPVVINFMSSADAMESPEMSVGTAVGVGIAVLVMSIIVIAIIIVITVAVKVHTRPKCPGKLVESGSDVKDLAAKSQTSSEVSSKEAPIGSVVITADIPAKSSHEMVLQKLNEYHDQKQSIPTKATNVNKESSQETKPKTAPVPILPKPKKTLSPAETKDSEVIQVKIEDGYAVPIPRTKTEKTHDSTVESAPAKLTSKAPPKPPRLRVGSTRANLSPSHHPLVDNQVLSDLEM